MKGYLDKLPLEQITFFKQFLLLAISDCNILKNFSRNNSINHKVFNSFFTHIISQFSY